MKVLGVTLALLAVALPGAASGRSATPSQPASQQLRMRPFATGFDSPVYVTAPRSEPGELYVVEQPGVIRVLEKAGIKRPPDLVLALTGDDEDNMVITQLAKEKYGVQKVIARVNDPRNQTHFDLLGISPTVSATRGLMALIEHEVPEHDLVHLLELRKENLEIVEVQIPQGAPAAGMRVEKLDLPEGSRLISIMRNGRSEIAVGATELQPGDQVLAILQPGKEDELRRVLLKAR